ncbi:MAG: glutamyl-tRNA synthetase [Bacteroidetes bacterium]|jgi:glutamyl-tRNA synthetase|nr:glutamyl-tRNA synthetase [Bacteroidota bacterium]
MENKRVRVRFAPSPTGGLHMGGVRVALFNYLFAKKHGGDFILRIEDTDQTRFVAGAEEYIINSLKWCGIEPNEGVGFGDGPHAPYRQSERKELGIYKKYADKLIEGGHAYYAFDTTEELDEMRKRMEAAKVAAPQYNAVSRQNMRNSLTLSEDEVKKLLDAGTPYVIRLKVPRNEEIRFHDIIRGWVVVNSSQVDDKVLLKSDGMPTYHLAHIVDDVEMKISHAMRGEEWLPSAPAHILIYRYLGLEAEMPQLAHLPLILKPDGHGKLSKRDTSGLPMFPLNWQDPRDNSSYVGYKESGFFPEAFINMLVLLGWNPGDNKEIMSKDELIQLFSLERINKAGAKFDPEKTKWFNQQYLRKKTDEELADIFMPMLKEHGVEASKDFVAKACKLIKEKAHFVNEFWLLGFFLFETPSSHDAAVLEKRLNAQSYAFIEELKNELSDLSSFAAAETEACFKATAEKTGIAPGQVMQLFRVVITGVSGGPALYEIMELIGKEESIKRMDFFLEKNKI